MSHIMLYKCPWITLEYFITVSEQFQKCSSGLFYNISKKKIDFSGTIVEHLLYHTSSLAPVIAHEVQFYIWNTVDMALNPKKAKCLPCSCWWHINWRSITIEETKQRPELFWILSVIATKLPHWFQIIVLHLLEKQNKTAILWNLRNCALSLLTVLDNNTIIFAIG